MSRFWRACSVGDEHGVALQRLQVANGRPLRFMRINGRSDGMWMFALAEARKVG